MTTRLIVLNGSRLSLAAAIVCLFASPAFAQTAPSRTGASPASQPPATETDKPSRDRSDPCSAAWIEAAAKQQVAPNVVGCNIKDVTLPLVRVGVLPSPGKHDGTEPVGQIVAQTPAAGAPLKRGGTLSLQVSTGKAPKPAQETPATSAAPEQPPIKQPGTPPVSSAAPAEPEPKPESASAAPEAVPSASAEQASPDLAQPPLLTPGRVTFKEEPSWLGIPQQTLWLLVGLVALVAGITGVLTTLRSKSGRKSSHKLPHVACEAEFGPGRLVRRGALVLGEKGID